MHVMALLFQINFGHEHDYLNAATGMDKRRVMWRRVMGELQLDQEASYG